MAKNQKSSEIHVQIEETNGIPKEYNVELDFDNSIGFRGLPDDLVNELRQS